MKSIKNTPLALCALVSALAVSMQAHAGAQDEAKGFVEGASLKMQNRLLYERLNYQHGDTTRVVKGPRSDKAEEIGYGLMLNFESGYTQGTVGFGVDAHAYGGLNLGADPDTVRSNPRYLARDDDDLKDAFGRAGAVVKLRFSNTELKYGEMRTKNPIFHSSDTRLLPETNRGWLLSSNEIKSLSLQAGRFTQWADRNSRKNGGELLANYSGVNGNSFTFAGGNWTTPVAGLSLSGYYGRYEDVWNTAYLGGFYKMALADKQSLSFSLNLYRNTDTGKAKAGKVDNTTWSLMSTYAFGVHKLGLGYQKVDGDTPFDYVNRGSIWLENAMQISDFNAPNEASWQLKYDVDLGQMVTSGLTAGVAYTRGSDIDYRRMNSVYTNFLGAPGSGGKHWERDMIVRYTVQEGKAKGLALQLRYSAHRANKAQGELSVDQIRLVAEMPLSIF
ncbi:OprD family porin [Thauera sp. Sel9]|uniref:OprD family porin n=1 Tax=Thauera sp. Sel9 TaxID=2974299 RepID=UPI0021E16863|nr:OprD family porin [Thauera sp. Sel9]MCV2218989.1 OprD family porin [Thauera sp. Sel9]